MALTPEMVARWVSLFPLAPRFVSELSSGDFAHVARTLLGSEDAGPVSAVTEVLRELQRLFPDETVLLLCRRFAPLLALAKTRFAEVSDTQLVQIASVITDDEELLPELTRKLVELRGQMGEERVLTAIVRGNVTKLLSEIPRGPLADGVVTTCPFCTRNAFHPLH